MMPLATKRRSPIGLDIGSRTIKAAQLVRAGSRLRLAAAVVLDRAEPGESFSSAEAERLRRVLGWQGFAGSSVVAAAPDQALLAGVLELPPRSSGAPVDQIARAEIGRIHRCEPDALEAAFWELPPPARPNSNGPMSLVVACAHDRAQSLLDALDGPGLELAGLDSRGWALARACSPLIEDPQSLTAVLDLGWRSGQLTLIHRGLVIYERVLGGVGVEAMIEAIRRQMNLPVSMIEHLLAALGLDEAAASCQEDRLLAGRLRGPLEAHLEHLAQELSLSLAYASSQYPDAPIERLLVTGAGASIPGLVEQLAQGVETPVTAVTPADVCDVPASLEAQARRGDLLAAVGLAMYPPELMT